MSRKMSLACARVESGELQSAMRVTAKTLEGGDEVEELLGLAAVGEGEDDVVGRGHAEVAVDGFGGMKEVGRGAGGAEGGGDLAGDDAGLADAGEEDALRSGGGEEYVHGRGEGREHGGVETEGEVEERGGFDADEVGGLDGGLGFAGHFAGRFAGHGVRAMMMLAEEMRCAGL